VAQAALTAGDRAAGRRAGAGSGPGGVRVGVDAAFPTDGAAVADAVAAAVRERGRPVARVRLQDYLRPRSLRLEHGPDSPQSRLDGWYDVAALRREVLDPLGPGGAGYWLPTLWDADRDRATRAERRQALPGTVAVVDGPFLLADALAGGFDLTVHLDVSAAARSRRLDPADAAVAAAWRLYVERDDPLSRADLVVRLEDPRRPALVEAGPA
jgi:hypothetical protein